jgi:GT2 family glycosyltransferase
VLGGLAAIEYPADRLELLVVSDGGTDGTVEMVRSVASALPFPVHVFEQPNRGPSAARNLALRHARGPFVLFLDDDVIPARNLLAEHCRSHGESSNRVVIGPLCQASDSSSPWVRWEARTLAKQYRAMELGESTTTAFDFYTGNASLLLAHLREAGGFDERLQRAEDVELGLRLARLGLDFVFNARAAGEHIAERSYRTWLTIARRYAHNHLVFDMPTDLIVGNFRGLHPLTKALIGWIVRHPRIERAVPALAWLGIETFDRLRMRDATDNACGATFNVSYWLGVMDQLGPEGAAGLIAQAAGPAAV